MFTNSCDEWREGTYETFKEWALRQFGVEELDSNDKAEVPAHLQKARDLPFDKNDCRVFILPPMHNYKTICQKQRVV